VSSIQSTPGIIVYDTVTFRSTLPCQFVNSIFTIPPDGDGFYNITVNGGTSTVAINLIDENNFLATVAQGLGCVSINYPLKSGYKVYATLVAGTTTPGITNYFTLVRVN
jgi:hypothetical protein